MPIQVCCPTGHTLNVSSKRAGTTVLCPACQSQVEVPNLASSVIEAAPTVLAGSPSGMSGLRLSSAAPAEPKPPPALKANRHPKPARVRRHLARRGSSSDIESDSAVAIAPPPGPPSLARVEVANLDFSPPRDSKSNGFTDVVTPRDGQPLKKKPRPANKFTVARAPVVRQSMVATSQKPVRDGYVADPVHQKAVHRLAMALGAFSLFTLAPVLEHWNLLAAPGWAQVVFLLAMVQLAYAVWLALTPDWSTAWVAMIALAGLATIYAAALAISLHTVRSAEAILNLSDLARAESNMPIMWCCTVIALASLLAYWCGVASYRWHKSFLTLAGRRT